MSWTVQNVINFVTGTGDKTNEAFTKHIAEFTEVYTLLNRLRSIDQGSTAPSDPETDAVWLDTSGSETTIKTYNGASWEVVLEIGSIDGLTVALEGKSASTHDHDADYLGKTATATDSSLLNGVVSDDDATGDTIVKRQPSGNIHTNSIHFTSGDVSTVPSHVFIETGTDGYAKPQTMAAFRAWLLEDNVIDSDMMSDNSVVKSNVADDAIGNNQITKDWTGTSSNHTWSPTGAGTEYYYIPDGVYLYSTAVTNPGSTAKLELYTNGTWGDFAEDLPAGMLICDATNVRFHAYGDAAATFYFKYTKLG